MITPLHNNIHPPEMERNPPKTVWGGVINNYYTRTILTLWSANVNGVWLTMGGVINNCHTHSALTLWSASVTVLLHMPVSP